MFNPLKLRRALREHMLEALSAGGVRHADVTKMKVGIALKHPDGPNILLNISHTSLAVYRDSGEATPVIWLSGDADELRVALHKIEGMRFVHNKPHPTPTPKEQPDG